jgi:DNA/RNA-binding domain of Phe-tRNA-synthetase-like protein
MELDMLTISATTEWQKAHPGAIIGLLELSGIDNSKVSDALNERKREIEARLRKQYQGFRRQDFLALPTMAAYDGYYNRFDKTYHVLLQVESIILKGKSLPNVSPLVDANFMAEVESLVLTAGHDVKKLQGSAFMDVSREGDRMIQMNGAAKDIRAGDMIMKDSDGICCSIIYGQDNRSPISPETTHVLYVAYVPAGVPQENVDAQLSGIEKYIRLFSPSAALEQRRLLKAETA